MFYYDGYIASRIQSKTFRLPASGPSFYRYKNTVFYLKVGLKKCIDKYKKSLMATEVKEEKLDIIGEILEAFFTDFWTFMV